MSEKNRALRATHVDGFVAGGERTFSQVGAVAMRDSLAFVIDPDGTTTSVSLATYARYASDMLELGAQVELQPGESLTMIGSDYLALLRIISRRLPAGLRALHALANNASTEYGAKFIAGSPGLASESRSMIEQFCVRTFDYDAGANRPSVTGLSALWQVIEIATTIPDKDRYIRGIWAHRHIFMDSKLASRLSWEALEMDVFPNEADLKLALRKYSRKLASADSNTQPPVPRSNLPLQVHIGSRSPKLENSANLDHHWARNLLVTRIEPSVGGYVHLNDRAFAAGSTAVFSTTSNRKVSLVEQLSKPTKKNGATYGER